MSLLYLSEPVTFLRCRHAGVRSCETTPHTGLSAPHFACVCRQGVGPAQRRAAAGLQAPACQRATPHASGSRERLRRDWMAPCKDGPAGKPAQDAGVNQLTAVTSRAADALAKASRQARRSWAAKVDAPLPAVQRCRQLAPQRRRLTRHSSCGEALTATGRAGDDCGFKRSMQHMC